MLSNKPRVSIGMPVYNGENFLKPALDSILAQTFEDFELIISDNASTDRTQEICQIYAAKDRRIRYYRNDGNLGASKNYNRVFELSLGGYFKWAAHDDVLAPEYLERCVEVLDQDPSIVLADSSTGKIDENGVLVGSYDYEMRVDSPKPHERLHDLICVPHFCTSAFALMRTSGLKTTPLVASYVSSDRNMLVALSLIGRFYIVPQQLFFRRDHAQTSIRSYGLQDRLGWFDPKKAGRLNLPTWRAGIEYFKSITRAPLNWSDRLLCYAQLGLWLKQKWIGLLKEIAIATQRFLVESKLGRKVLTGVKPILLKSRIGSQLVTSLHQHW